ncbi:MAG: helicase-associated domain-containing protein [Pelolinea sp.]|nr:helicase-associated domain-containing protein [Pelolinea sp.]
MPTISETFQDYETDMLEMIAEQWGIADDIIQKQNIKKQLSNLLNNKELFSEIIQSLSADAQSALQFLLNDGGKTQTAQFTRRFGEIREMGAGAREKEHPDRNPISTSESLFYRGLIALSFFNERNEAEEFIYIPSEFITFIKPTQEFSLKAHTPRAYPETTLTQKHYASDEILDHMCSLLAAIRGKIPTAEVSQVIPSPIQRFLNTFFYSQEIIDKKAAISDTNKIKELLLDERDAAFSKACISWMENKSLNELKLLPNLRFEGKWKNEPAKTRKKLLDIISNLIPDAWYSITDFVDWMQKIHPDFQRSRGEYDLWFIKDVETDNFINGFENWQQVEGQLLEYFLTGPLFWFGIIDLASNENSDRMIGFKKSKWATTLLNKQFVKYNSPETSECILHSNGEVLVQTNTQREIRYQIARFCVWEKKNPNHYRFKISSSAIRRADAQKITVNQIKTLFEKYGKKPVPKNLFIALDRWNKGQLQIELKDQILIRVDSAEILDKIQKSPAKQYIIERLNPTTAIVSSDNLNRLEDAIIKLGYFADIWHEV